MSEHTLAAQGLAKVLARLAPGPAFGELGARLAAFEMRQATWSDRDGVVILDAAGRITFCSTAAAALLGAGASEIVGQHVTALIPELPFGRYTPEFNLAYVFFHGDDGVWARRALKTRDGKRIPVDVSLGTSSEIGQRSIVLILRKAAGDGDEQVVGLDEVSDAAGA